MVPEPNRARDSCTFRSAEYLVSCSSSLELTSFIFIPIFSSKEQKRAAEQMLSLVLPFLAISATGAQAGVLGARDVSNVPTTFSSLTACSGIKPVYSCENTTAIQNTCCSPTPGGLQLLTQFWSTYTGLESKGQFLPSRSWTIHGAWPDFCDGSYTQYCDLTRQYDPAPSPNTTDGKANGTVVPPWKGEGISNIIKRFGRYDLLDYMNGFWINQGDTNEVFWAHEFSKHATCTSTFDISCYANYVKDMEVIDFFQSAIRGFKMFPTYDILASAGIVPSNKTTYTLKQFNDAFYAQTGSIPYWGCTADPVTKNKTTLSEIWVYTHVLGTPQHGQYKTINTTFPSSCAATGINYFERTPASEVSKYLS
ncbi:ribonuclease T2 [Meredithblackwellia eburnea MCA 4105]